MAEGSLGLAQLSRDLYRMSPALRSRLGKTIRDLGKGMESDAKSNASWSSRIPGAIKVSGTVTPNAVGVALRVSTGAAPHARPYEGLDGGSSFRHPVYGGPAWVSQGTRPYARPAQEKAGKELPEAGMKAIEEAAAEAGFR